MVLDAGKIANGFWIAKIAENTNSTQTGTFWALLLHVTRAN